jgi:hypothetical protein
MLGLNWYSEVPIDFEHKNYLLLDYVMKIDESYSNLKLSPYLLWTEKLVDDMDIFILNHVNFNMNLKREFKKIENFSLIYEKHEELEEIKEIIEIVEYSKPILLSKIEIGYRLFQRYPQILF